MNLKAIKRNIGKILLKARNESGMTQADVSSKYKALSGKEIDERTIRRYEDGDITLEGLLYMSEIYNKTVDYFLYGHETMRNDSLRWEDQLKRLNRLVYSAVLIPEKYDDVMSPYYGKYCYISLDEETNVHMERIETMCKTKNYLNRKGKPDFNHLLKDFDDDVTTIVDKDEEIKLELNRIIKLFKKNNEDPIPFIKQAIEIAQKNADANQPKKKGN